MDLQTRFIFEDRSLKEVVTFKGSRYINRYILVVDFLSCFRIYGVKRLMSLVFFISQATSLNEVRKSHFFRTVCKQGSILFYQSPKLFHLCRSPDTTLAHRFRPVHRGAFCQYTFRWIYYYGRINPPESELAKRTSVQCLASTFADQFDIS